MTSAPRSTRREFLQGKAAVDAVLEAAALNGPSEDAPDPAGSYLVQFARRAMACQFEVFLNAGQYDNDSQAALAALDLVDELESQLSVFRSESEISQLNRHAGDRPVTVEPRLFELLQTAVRIHEETGGAYDVTSGALSAVWGFTRRAGTIPSDVDLALARQRVGSEYLDLDVATRSVRFLRPELQINLGSIGKGYALDRCAEQLSAAGINDFLLHGGNSSVLGRGSHGSLPRQHGWTVGVRNPLRPEQRLGHVRLRDRALSTSGSGTQFFMHQGRRYGHILDPRTGWPAEGVLSVSVLAPTTAEADALSTALYVMGPQAAGEFCRQRPQIAVIMICAGHRAGSIEKTQWGLDPQDWVDIEP